MTTEEQKRFIKEILHEVSLASHQSKDSEVSGLFVDIKKELRALNDKLYEFENSIEIRATSWDLTTRIVYGLITIMLIALVGSLVGLVLK